MPSFLAIKMFLGKAWPFLLAAAVVGILTLSYCEGKKSAQRQAELERAKANEQALDDLIEAEKVIGGERLNDAVRSEKESGELKEAIDDAKAKGADPRAAFYQCVLLQQAARKAGRPAPECG